MEVGGHENEQEGSPAVRLGLEVEGQKDEGHGHPHTYLRHVVQHHEVAHVDHEQQEILVRELCENEALERDGQQRVDDEDAPYVVERGAHDVADEDEGGFYDVVELPQVVAVVLQRVLVDSEWSQGCHQRDDADGARVDECACRGTLVFQIREGSHADQKEE